MAVIMMSPKFRAVDNNGDALSGGKVYSYVANTLTPLATYPTIADAEASTNANTNPVILDSRGEANIVISGATKLILTTADGSPTSPIWTVDGITDVSNNQITEVKDSDGNDVVVFNGVGSAENWITLTNAQSGSAPIIATNGLADTNIGLTIDTKGSGIITLNSQTNVVGNTAVTGTFSVSSTSTLSGTNTISGLVYPTADGTLSGQAIKTNASGTLSLGNVITTVTKTVFTSSSTYTKTAGTLYAEFILLGGGGGGGGATAGGGQRGIGGGGGAGALVRQLLTSAQIGTGGSFTIGAAGAAGSAATGGAGGNTTITFNGSGTITLTANGGAGGITLANYAGAGQASAGGSGGTIGAGGDSTSTIGQAGFSAYDATSANIAITGRGASSMYGSGGAEKTGTTSQTGNAASGYGAGGSGAFCPASSSSNGGAGSPGLMIVTEYICS